MKIVVFGSTGGTGLQLLSQALARGHHVVAVARDPQRISLSNTSLEVVRGDVLDYDAVVQAVSGADAVISALGVRLGQPPGTTRSDGTRNIVEALQAQGVKRFLSVSTIGAGDSLSRLSFVGRFLLPRMIGAERLKEAERQEEIIRSTSLEWIVLRPPRLVDNPGTGHYRIGTDLRTGMNSKMTRADLAKVLLDQVANNAFLHSCPSVIN